MLNSFTLSVVDWSATSPGLYTKQDWLKWQLGDPLLDTNVDTERNKPKLPEIPAMLRRRLSHMGKSALASAYDILHDFDKPHASVFCSQHGEVLHTVGLLRELAEQQPLSPTAFSLSVHNAIGGIHSIARNITGNITAISAGPDSICAALLEAYALLQEHNEYEHVLCVVYDNPLPEIYDLKQQIPDQPFAAAFIVAKENASDSSLKINVELQQNPTAIETSQPAFSFINFLATPTQNQLTIGHDHRLWQWRKL